MIIHFNYSCMEIIHIKIIDPMLIKYNQYIDGSIFIMIRQMEGKRSVGTMYVLIK